MLCLQGVPYTGHHQAALHMAADPRCRLPYKFHPACVGSVAQSAPYIMCYPVNLSADFQRATLCRSRRQLAQLGVFVVLPLFLSVTDPPPTHPPHPPPRTPPPTAVTGALVTHSIGWLELV